MITNSLFFPLYPDSSGLVALGLDNYHTLTSNIVGISLLVRQLTKYRR